MEYVVIISIAVAALVAMSAYLKSAIQGRYRESADTFGRSEQYEKGRSMVLSSSGIVLNATGPNWRE